MRCNIAATILVLSQHRFVVATIVEEQHNTTDLISVLGKRQPTGLCTLNCFSEILPRFDCPDLLECICADDAVADALRQCVTARGCSFEEALQGQKVRAETCDYPKRNRVMLFTIFQTVFFSLAVICAVLRVLARGRYLGGTGYGWDDAILFATCLPTIGLTVVGYMGQIAGLGRDIWELELSQIENVLKLFYIGNTFYIPIVFGTKIAFVLLYLRIWKDSPKAFQRTCQVILVILTVAMLGFTLSTVSLCAPGYYTWKALSRTKGRCVNREAQLFSGSAVNIAMSLVVLSLPVPRIVQINMNWPKKIGLLCTYLVGFTITGTSIFQYYYLITKVPDTKNPTWDYFDIGIWRAAETYLSIICCCMPMITDVGKRVLRHASNASSVPSRISELWRKTNTLTTTTTSKSHHDSKLTSTVTLTGSVSLTDSWVELENVNKQDNKQFSQASPEAPCPSGGIHTPNLGNANIAGVSTSSVQAESISDHDNTNVQGQWNMYDRELLVSSNPKSQRRGSSALDPECSLDMKSRISKFDFDTFPCATTLYGTSSPRYVGNTLGADHSNMLHQPVGRRSRRKAEITPFLEREYGTQSSKVAGQRPGATRQHQRNRSNNRFKSDLPPPTPSPRSDSSEGVDITPDQILTWARRSQSQILHQAQLSAARREDERSPYAYMDERMRMEARIYNDRALPETPDACKYTAQWI